jgi:hypothetical protein
MPITAIFRNVVSGEIPKRYHKYIKNCINFSEVRNGYYRRIEEYSTETEGLTIVFIWHTHDGLSGTHGTELIVDFMRNGKYL